MNSIPQNNSNQNQTILNKRAHLKPLYWITSIVILAALVGGYFVYQNYLMQKTVREMSPLEGVVSKITREQPINQTETSKTTAEKTRSITLNEGEQTIEIDVQESYTITSDNLLIKFLDDWTYIQSPYIFFTQKSTSNGIPLYHKAEFYSNGYKLTFKKGECAYDTMWDGDVSISVLKSCTVSIAKHAAPAFSINHASINEYVEGYKTEQPVPDRNSNVLYNHFGVISKGILVSKTPFLYIGFPAFKLIELSDNSVEVAFQQKNTYPPPKKNMIDFVFITPFGYETMSYTGADLYKSVQKQIMSGPLSISFSPHLQPNPCVNSADPKQACDLVQKNTSFWFQIRSDFLKENSKETIISPILTDFSYEARKEQPLTEDYLFEMAQYFEAYIERHIKPLSREEFAHYTNPSLGIAFDYPKEWGEVYSSSFPSSPQEFLFTFSQNPNITLAIPPQALASSIPEMERTEFEIKSISRFNRVQLIEPFKDEIYSPQKLLTSLHQLMNFITLDSDFRESSLSSFASFTYCPPSGDWCPSLVGTYIQQDDNKAPQATLTIKQFLLVPLATREYPLMTVHINPLIELDITQLCKDIRDAGLQQECKTNGKAQLANALWHYFAEEKIARDIARFEKSIQISEP